MWIVRMWERAECGESDTARSFRAALSVGVRETALQCAAWAVRTSEMGEGFTHRAQTSDQDGPFPGAADTRWWTRSICQQITGVKQPR